jgi:fibronectin-binding autotransporter adhesin
MKDLKIRSPFKSMAATFAAFTFLTFTARAVDGTWTSLTSGNWSDTTRWTGGNVASGEGAIANLTANFTSPITIALDGNRTVGTLNYNDSGNNPDVANLIVSHATSVLTLDALAGSPDISITGTNVLILDVVLAGSEGLIVGKTGNNDNSRIYLNKKATFTGNVTMQRGRLYLNAGNNTLPTGKLISWLSQGANAGAILALNGNTQEVAGLTTTAGELDERIYNDSATPGLLIINVPGVSSNSFDGSRLGYSSATSDENNFGVIKEGTGTQTINQNGNGYTGETVINNGILDVNNAAGSLGATSAGTTVNPGGTLTIRGTDAVFAEPLTLKGTGFGGTNGALTIAGGGGGVGTGPTWSGNITLGANATIRTEANLTVSSGITDNLLGFGFTKTGAGFLGVSSPSVAGSSFVNEGTLGLGASASLGGLTLASGAALDVTNQIYANALTFSGGSAVLNIHYGALGGSNPTTPAVNDTLSGGNVTLANNATVAINITGSDFVPTAGAAIVLIDYGTKSGSGSFVKGSLPPGVVGAVSDDGSRIILTISAVVNQLTWFGSTNANWDLTTLNWNSGTTNYQETGGVGDIVTFDDTLFNDFVNPPNTNVNLTTTVRPAVMNVVNSAYPYRFSGAGKISGGATLNKSGSASLTMATGNDYTNGTTILDGAVLLGDDAALGTGTITLNASGGFGFPVLSSDSGTARTLVNGLKVLGTATLGDLANSGALSFSGPVSFGEGGLRNVTFNSDTTWSGSVSLGGMNKLGTNTLTLTGATADLTEALEVREGTIILDGISVTNQDAVRADAQALPTTVARLVITNGASVTTLGPANNIRSGQDSTAPGTNIVDLAGTYRVPNANASNGELRLERQSALYSEFNLLAGGDAHARRVVSEGTGTGITRLNFNGGILRARNNSLTFMQGLDQAVILNGGANISTEGYDITIAQALLAGGTGGLTKTGGGTLTLTGSNTFSGPLAVNAGAVVVGSAHAGTGAASVADGALLAFESDGAGQIVRFASATVGVSTGATLEFRFYNQTGVPPSPAGFSTNLTLKGTITVNVASLAGATAGSVIPLLGYGTLSGTPTLVTGTLPEGIAGTIANNGTTKQIELTITSVTPLLWTGASSALWDLTTTNWTLAGVPAVFGQGGSVRFDDTGLQPNVVMVTNVSPSQVVVSNGIVAYNISSVGGVLAGGANLIKEGTNLLTLGGANTFSGTVTVKAGTLSVNNNSSLGSTAGGTVIENGATLDINAVPGLEPITVSGDGVGGLGALYRSGAAADDTLRSVTLTGDTTVGTAGDRWDINTQADSDLGLKGNGFKLTKVGNGQISIVGTDSATNLWDSGLGDVEVKQGTLMFSRRMTMGQANKSVLVHSNATLAIYSTAVTDVLGQTNILMKNVFLTNATLSLQGDATTAPVIFGGPIQVNGECVLNATTDNGAALDGVISGSGSVRKIGVNLVTLGAVNTYTGDTVISNATLALGPSASINNSPTIFVDGDATFDVAQVSGYTLAGGQTLKGFGAVNGSVQASGTVAPGDSIGTLTFTNDLTLAGTNAMELTRDGGQTNDVIIVLGTLTYGGTLRLEVLGATALQVNDTFKLFSFPAAPGGVFSAVLAPAGYTFDTSLLNADGTVRVTSTPMPTTPTNITVVVSASDITLSWPAIYTGWYLQAQTNARSVGLSNNWVTIPNSSTNNSFTFPLDPANGSVFYRMSLQP